MNTRDPTFRSDAHPVRHAGISPRWKPRGVTGIFSRRGIEILPPFDEIPTGPRGQEEECVRVGTSSYFWGDPSPGIPSSCYRHGTSTAGRLVDRRLLRTRFKTRRERAHPDRWRRLPAGWQGIGGRPFGLTWLTSTNRSRNMGKYSFPLPVSPTPSGRESATRWRRFPAQKRRSRLEKSAPFFFFFRREERGWLLFKPMQRDVRASRSRLIGRPTPAPTTGHSYRGPVDAAYPAAPRIARPALGQAQLL